MAAERPPKWCSWELFSGDIGLCLIKSAFFNIAAAPTRFAEYLTAGMPVIVTVAWGTWRRW